MRCSGCGKDVPFGGHVCPYCHRDKGADQHATVVTGFFLIVGGGLGWLVGGSIGLLIGGFAVGLIAAFMTAGTSSKAARKAPAVRIEPPLKRKALPTEKAGGGAEARLIKLEDLRAQNLITAEEYVTRRKAIVDSL